MPASLSRAARLSLARLAAVFALAVPAPALAEPALWKVQGPHATVWLFGSVHVLKPELRWRTPPLDSALKSADGLYLEIDNADDPAAMQPLILRYGMDAAHPLSSRLPADELAALDGALKTYGLSGAAVQVMRPWMVGVMLSTLPLLKAGYDTDASVEHAFAAEEKAAGKPVRGLETAEQQVRFLADLPPTEELAFLKSSLDDAAKGTEEIDRLVAAWQAGDVDTVARLMNEDFEKESPTLYRRLIVERNQRFAHQIADLANGAGIWFVAVGAGHLAGPDSIQADLAHLGLQAIRQ